MKKVVVFLLALATVGCVSKEQNESEAVEETTASAQATAAPAISFLDVDGKVVELSSFKDQTVFVNFWATWCGPCIKEMPSIQALYEKYKTNPNVKFLVVEIDNDLPLAKRFAESQNYTFPVYSLASNVPQSILGGSIPTTVVFDKAGSVAFHHVGMSDFNSDSFLNTFEGIVNK